MTDTLTEITTDTRTELRTFLFADIRGYTRFTQEEGDEAAVRLVTKFAGIIRDVVRPRGGRLIELRGDEALVVFGSARQALRAAVDLQARFAAETEADPSLPLRAGIGIDAGEAVPLDDGYRGEALNVAARLCNLAGPGEVLASEGVVYLGRRVQGVGYAVRGVIQMKGVVEQVRVIRVLGQSSAQTGAAPGTEALGLLSAGAGMGEETLPIGGFLGALPSGPLVGRTREWEQAIASLEAVSAGRGRLLLLSGEPGIGKTRLAQELALKARHWHFLVATGRCYDLERSVPFYPFLEALATIYTSSPAFIRAEIPRRWPYLIRLLPDELAPGAGALGLQPELDGPASGQTGAMPRIMEQEDQQKLFRAVTGFITMVADTMPVALLLDDLHWADDASLQLLAHLARYTRGHRILLAGTYRDVELHRQHPLETTLLDLNREHLITEVEVRRLSQEETAALMAEVVGENEDLAELAELVYRRTDGNAFFIQEVMQALMERGEIYRKDGRWERRAVREMEVPKSIRSAIGQRLSHLAERSQEILREASVLGQQFSFNDLIAMISAARADASWSEDEVEEALEEASGAGLVRETADDRYDFNHALTQQALYAELTTRRRKRLHLAAGRALEGARSRHGREHRAAELAWHFLEGDDPERALTYSLLAGDEAEALFANGDAERHYRTALELAQELHDHERLLEAREKLADVLTVIGRYDKALELLERTATEQHEAGNVEDEACVVAKIGHVHFLRGTRDEGVARLMPLIESLDHGEPTYGLAALWAALARLYMDSDRYEEQMKAAERAVTLARALDEKPGIGRLLIGAEITLGDALWWLGKEEESLRVMEGLIPRAEAAGDLDNLARALNNTAMYYARRGEIGRDRAYQERALKIAERRGDRFHIVLTSMALSQSFFRSGDWPQSRLYLERAEAAIASLRTPSLSIWPTIAHAWQSLREGDGEAAAEQARQTLAIAEGMGDTDYARLAERLLAEHDLLASPGDVDVARRVVEQLEPLGDTPGAKNDTGFWRVLAWAQLAAGEPESAGETADISLEQAREFNGPAEMVETLAIHGMVMASLGRWNDAEHDFAEGFELTQRFPLAYGEARILYEWGAGHAGRGELEPARERLEAALAIFQRLEAKGEVERTEKALAELKSPAEV